MRLLPSWLLAGALLAGCSLTGDPKYYRPLPTDGALADSALDDAQRDGAIVDPDGEAPGDSGPADGGPADGGPADGGVGCAPNDAVELCNGVDDNCNGIIDDALVSTVPVPCVTSAMVPGVLRGCECVANPQAVETCFNGLDDNGNGAVDDGCACDAAVIPNGTTNAFVSSLLNVSSGTVTVYPSVTRAIEALPSRRGTVCVLKDLTATCAVATAHVEDFEIPAAVVVVGGFTVSSSAMGRRLVPNASEECRTLINGRVTFRDDATTSSVLARVTVARSVPGPVVRMNRSGWIYNAAITAIVSAGGDAVAIAGEGDGLRLIGASSIEVKTAGEAAGILVNGGSTVVYDTQLSVQSLSASDVATGIRADNARLTVLNQLTLLGMRAGGELNGVFVSGPQGATLISGLTGGAEGSQKSFGLRFESTAAAPPFVQMSGVRWSGGDARDEAVGLWAHGVRAQVLPRLPGGAAATSEIFAKDGAQLCERVEALRCDSGARCEVIGTIGSRVLLQSHRDVSANMIATNARGAFVGSSATALLQLVNVVGGRSARSTAGIEMNGRGLALALSEVLTGPAPSAIGVDLAGGVQATLLTNVLRGDQGIALQIAADRVTSTRVVSNTIVRLGDPRTALNQLVNVLSGGARTVHFENNLLACGTGAQIGVQTPDSPSVFSTFAYNLIAGCDVPATVGTQDIVTALLIQSRFAPPAMMGVGPVQLATSAGLAADGVHLIATSPARDIGAQAARTTVDFDGQGRGRDVAPDIGADEFSP